MASIQWSQGTRNHEQSGFSGQSNQGSEQRSTGTSQDINASLNQGRRTVSPSSAGPGKFAHIQQSRQNESPGTPDTQKEGEEIRQEIPFKIFSDLVRESANSSNPADQRKIEIGLTIARLRERENKPLYPSTIFRELAKSQSFKAEKPAEMLGDLRYLSLYLRLYLGGKVITAQRHQGTESGISYSYSIGSDYESYAKDMYILMRHLSSTLAVFGTSSLQAGQTLTKMFFDNEGNQINKSVTFAEIETKFRELHGIDIAYMTLKNQLNNYFEPMHIIKQIRSPKLATPIEISPDTQFPSLYKVISSLERFQKGDRTVLTDAYAFDTLLDKHPPISQGLARALWNLDKHKDSIDRNKTLENIQAELSGIISQQGQMTAEELLSQPGVNRFDPRTWSALLFLVRDRVLEYETIDGMPVWEEKDPVKNTKEDIMNILTTGGIFETDVEVTERYYEKKGWQIQEDISNVHAYSNTNQQSSVDQIIQEIPLGQYEDMKNSKLPLPVRKRITGNRLQLFVNQFGEKKVQFYYDEKEGLTSNLRHYHENVIAAVKSALREAYAKKNQKTNSPVPDDAQLDQEVNSLLMTIAKKDSEI